VPGEPDDFRQAPLGEEARRIAETLLSSGPLPTAVLRQAVGLQGRRGGARFSAAVVQLGRMLVCTSIGTEQIGAGWPSVVLELTARAFDLGGRDPDEAARRLGVGRRFLDTMLEASARELVIVLGWPPAAAHAALGVLVDRGEAVLDAGAYHPACSAGTRPGGSGPDFLRARDNQGDPATSANVRKRPLTCAVG
jgi:hypothetical protein